MNMYRQKSGYIIRHSRFTHERMFLCQRLFHECLGYDLDGIPLDAKTCPGLIPELNGFIPYEDLPNIWVFQQLALFHKYGNRKLAAVPGKEKISAYCQICIALVQGGQHFLLNHSLPFTKFSYFVIRWYIPWIHTNFGFSSSNHIIHLYKAGYSIS